MNPNMYSMYYSRIKGPDPLISRRKEGYVVGVTQLKPVPPIEQLVQNQYLIRVPTYGLEQSIFITRGVHVQQIMEPTLHVNIFVTIGLPIYGNDVPIQQPRRVNPHPQPNGKPSRGLLNGGPPKGGSLYRNSPGGPPLDPHVGFYGWLTPNPRIFMSPWYQLVPIRFEPTSKLPY